MVRINFQDYLIIVYTAFLVIFSGIIVNISTDMFKACQSGNQNYNYSVSTLFLLMAIGLLLLSIILIKEKAIGKKDRVSLVEIKKELEYGYLLEIKKILSNDYDVDFNFEVNLVNSSLLAYVIIIISVLIINIFKTIVINNNLSANEILFIICLCSLIIIMALGIYLSKKLSIDTCIFHFLNKYRDISIRSRLIGGGLFDDKTLDLVIAYDKNKDNEIKGKIYLEHSGYAKDKEDSWEDIVKNITDKLSKY